jgi:DNA-binding XRE family transcriptional regulator
MKVQLRMFGDYEDEELEALDGRYAALAFSRLIDRDRVRSFVLALRAARLEVGLTKDELAERADISPFALNRIERGDQMPTLKQARALADALDVVPVTAEQLRDEYDYQDDEAAQYAVDMHPGGLTGEQVAELMQLSPSAIDVAQCSAFEKLRALADQDDDEGDDVREWLERIAEAREAREEREAASQWASADESCAD